jgi:hypothetical protein
MKLANKTSENLLLWPPTTCKYRHLDPTAPLKAGIGERSNSSSALRIAVLYETFLMNQMVYDRAATLARSVKGKANVFILYDSRG